MHRITPPDSQPPPTLQNPSFPTAGPSEHPTFPTPRGCAAQALASTSSHLAFSLWQSVGGCAAAPEHGILHLVFPFASHCIASHRISINISIVPASFSFIFLRVNAPPLQTTDPPLVSGRRSGCGFLVAETVTSCPSCSPLFHDLIRFSRFDSRTAYVFSPAS